jgi:hypothetical protein
VLKRGSLVFHELRERGDLYLIMIEKNKFEWDHMKDVNPTETSDNWARFDAMTDKERHQAAMFDPDAIPMTEEELENAPIVPRVKTLRRALKLTQEFELGRTATLPLRGKLAST